MNVEMVMMFAVKKAGQGLVILQPEAESPNRGVTLVLINLART